MERQGRPAPALGPTAAALMTRGWAATVGAWCGARWSDGRPHCHLPVGLVETGHGQMPAPAGPNSGGHVRVQVSQTIDRPVATVFRFYARDHVQNHPRWDPMMELEQISDGPIGVGTVIRRRNTHFGEPVEGTMEVTEFEEDRAFGVTIRDGDTETFGRMACEPAGPNRTEIIISADMPWLEDTEVSSRLKTMIQGTADSIKALIEAET